jgi:RNA polymerase sigma factor (sigma-70 family)
LLANRRDYAGFSFPAEVSDRPDSSKYIAVSVKSGTNKEAGLIAIDDRRLVEAVLAGESDLYRRLIDKYQGLVFRTISGIVGARPEVEDLAQETFWQAYRGLRCFRGEARFSTWLLRIAVNKAIDFCRRRREESVSLEGCEPWGRASAGDGAPERIVLEREQVEHLYRYLEQLPAHYRQVLRRHYLDGFSYREIAVEAKVPLKTVESRLYRARKMLRALWGEAPEARSAQPPRLDAARRE